jgi:hypothetical protein
MAPHRIGSGTKPAFGDSRQEDTMADDKNDRGAQDRARISGQPYEVAYFAAKHNIDQKTARDIIDRHGPSREACDREAARKG